MKFKHILLMILFTNLTTAASVETETLFLSGSGTDNTVDWEFKVTGGRRAGEWTTIPVPSNWELQGFGEYNYGHDKPKADEKGLYKHAFNIPDDWQDKRIFIVFEGSMTDTKVEINGKSAGPAHQGGFYRFRYDITTLLKLKKENLLEVEVSKMSSNESINQAERQADYWVFGGIFRPVYLKAVPKEYIDWTAIDARHTGEFRMNVHLGSIEDADQLEAQIVGMNGVPISAPFYTKVNENVSMVTMQTEVGVTKLWTAETPHLFYVDVSLKKGDTPIHSIRERFGFRTIEVRDGQGIFLNDEPIVLKGCDRHSFWPTTGRALNRNQCRDDVLTMKAMNMNAVRMSHYPPDTWFLEACDELGLYVLDELAGWQKPPYDTPTGERLVKQIVKRDVNHPSILFWDNGNEGGWNRDTDDEFGKWDPQNRRVLHPWELFGGIDTDHYENYETTKKKMDAGNIFMPTEYLHGLYDGGHGAGLEDYWDVMWGHPLTGGLFLWVFADEGVVRTDLNGIIDTDGNHAPDGILGPFHQREASFYTIREMWSPIYIDSNWKLPADFDGNIPVENRYDFINLNECSFEWKLVNFAKPGQSLIGHEEIARFVSDGPEIPARANGKLSIPLPDKWWEVDALIVSAFDANKKQVCTWSWPITSNKDRAQAIVKAATDFSRVRMAKDELTVSVNLFNFTFDENTGMLANVKNGAKTIPFSNGPVFVASDYRSKSGTVKLETSQRDQMVEITVTEHPDFDKLMWTILPTGWVKLNYAYSYDGPVDYMGVSFDFPENRMKAKTWLGTGAYRVWKNRLKGGTLDVWHNTYKNFQVNTAWDYPEFVGYFDDFNWVVFDTQDGPITIAAENDDLFMRLYSQADGDDPRHTKMIWPDGDLSFLHAIPAIGTKFKAAQQYGPMSQKFQASGTFEGTLYFYFGAPH